MGQHAKPLFEDWIFSRHCLLSKTEWWSFCLFVCFWAPLLNTLNRSGFLTQAFNAGDGKKSCFDAKLEKHVLCKKTVRSIRPDWNRMSNSCFLARWACMATAAVGQSFLSIVTGKRRFCLRTRQLSPADYVKWRPIRFFAAAGIKSCLECRMTTWFMTIRKTSIYPNIYPKLFATPEIDHRKSGFTLFSPTCWIQHLGKNGRSWSDSKSWQNREGSSVQNLLTCR